MCVQAKGCPRGCSNCSPYTLKQTKTDNDSLSGRRSAGIMWSSVGAERTVWPKLQNRKNKKAKGTWIYLFLPFGLCPHNVTRPRIHNERRSAFRDQWHELDLTILVSVSYIAKQEKNNKKKTCTCSGDSQRFSTILMRLSSTVRKQKYSIQVPCFERFHIPWSNSLCSEK